MRVGKIHDISFVLDDLTPYFVDETKKAFLVNVENELAGFVFLNTLGRLPDTQWVISEFFIGAKFQNKGIGEQVAHQLWTKYPGKWKINASTEIKVLWLFGAKLL